MTRSQKKLPYVNARLIEKIKKTIDKAREVAKKENRPVSIPPITTYARNCTIVDLMVGLVLQVHNGRKFVEVKISEKLLGHKLGEFSPTRTFTGHPVKRKEEPKKEKK